MNQLKKLKVKIKSLAGESRDIRQEERKAGRSIGRLLRHLADPKCEDRHPQYRRWCYDAVELHGDLLRHRRLDVRSELRCANLAYAFLRNVPLENVEAKSDSEPNWRRVFEIVLRFGVPIVERGPQTLRFQAWMGKYAKEPCAPVRVA